MKAEKQNKERPRISAKQRRFRFQSTIILSSLFLFLFFPTFIGIAGENKNIQPLSDQFTTIIDPKIFTSKITNLQNIDPSVIISRQGTYLQIVFPTDYFWNTQQEPEFMLTDITWELHNAEFIGFKPTILDLWLHATSLAEKLVGDKKALSTGDFQRGEYGNMIMPDYKFQGINVFDYWENPMNTMEPFLDKENSMTNITDLAEKYKSFYLTEFSVSQPIPIQTFDHPALRALINQKNQSESLPYSRFRYGMGMARGYGADLVYVEEANRLRTIFLNLLPDNDVVFVPIQITAHPAWITPLVNESIQSISIQGKNRRVKTVARVTTLGENKSFFSGEQIPLSRAIALEPVVQDGNLFPLQNPQVQPLPSLISQPIEIAEIQGVLVGVATSIPYAKKVLEKKKLHTTIKSQLHQGQETEHLRKQIQHAKKANSLKRN